jgi:hypothetical protein
MHMQTGLQIKLKHAMTPMLLAVIVDYSALRMLVVDYSASRMLVVAYFTSAARRGTSARRAARHSARRAARRRLLGLAHARR